MYDSKRVPNTRGMRFDYKDVENLRRFMTERGNILSREKTGISNKQQRELANAIKRARHVALLPFVQTM